MVTSKGCTVHPEGIDGSEVQPVVQLVHGSEKEPIDF